jgi:hypothetical protein
MSQLLTLSDNYGSACIVDVKKKHEYTMVRKFKKSAEIMDIDDISSQNKE